MNAEFWNVKVRPADGGPSWERYFTYCPTVQQIHEIARSEDAGWGATLELLAHLKPSLTGTYEITVRVARTVVGYVTVTEFEAYTK